MRLKGTAILIALMVWALAAPAFAATSPFEDVPADHWAYDAVTKLAAAGLVIGYPDGTFGGDRLFTRYEMAMVFARILDRLEIWIDDRFAGASDELKGDIYAQVASELDKQLSDLRKQLAEKPEKETVVERIIEKPVRQVIETTVVEKPFELTDEAKAVLAEFVAEQLAGEAEQLVKGLEADMDHVIFAATSAELAAEQAGKKADAAQEAADAAALEAKGAADKAAAAFKLGTKNTSDLVRVKAAIAALKGDKESVREYIKSEVESLGAELAALSNEFRDELDVIGLRMKNLETVFSKLYDRVDNLEAAVEANTAAIESNKAAIESSIAAVESNKAAIESNRAAIAANTAEVNALEQKTQALAGEDETLKEQLASIDKRVKELQKASDDAWAENIGRDAKLANLDARVEALEKSTEVDEVAAELAALREDLNKLRFSGSLESEYTSEGNYGEDAGATKSFTQKATVEATMVTSAATVKASVGVTTEFEDKTAQDPSFELKVRAEDISFLGMDWYGELAQVSVGDKDDESANFNFGVSKGFTLMEMPATFAVDESVDLNCSDENTTEFTLTLDQFMLDNLSVSVGYEFKNDVEDSSIWKTGFELALSPVTISLDWENNDQDDVTKTSISATIPVISDTVEVTVGGAKKIRQSDDEEAYDFNGAVKVKF